MKKFTLLAIAAVMTIGSAEAATYFGSPTGAGTMEGDSWENAMAIDIDNAFSASNAKAGDVFYLLEGTYTGTACHPATGISIIGGFPATATGTDLSGYNPWSYKTIFDAEGKNGAAAIVKISGSASTVDELCTTIKGIVITGAVGEKDKDDSFHGTAFNSTHAWVLMEDVVFDGNTTIKGGVVVPASGSKFHAKHCVWINNKNIRTDIASTDGNNNCFQPVLNGRGKAENERTSVVLEGCVMVNNTIENEAARKAASYGGAMNFQDSGGASLMMINCFADGGGQTTKVHGGFLRTGNSGGEYPSLNIFAFNTIFNYGVTNSNANGQVISINGNAPYYLQGNIIVDAKTGTKLEQDDNGIVTYGNNTDVAVFAATFSDNWGKYVTLIESGGDNIIGGFHPAVSGTQKEDSKTYTTNIIKQFPTDNWSAPAQSEIFDDVTTEKNGRHYITPKAQYCHINVEEAVANFKKYQENDLYKKWFGWADVDLSKDLYGNKRAETTYRGAYDPNASFVQIPLPTSVNEIAASKLSVKALGNGVFCLAGVEGSAAVYDINGRMIANVADGEFSLADAPAGIYIIRSGATSVKIIR